MEKLRYIFYGLTFLGFFLILIMATLAVLKVFGIGQEWSAWFVPGVINSEPINSNVIHEAVMKIDKKKFIEIIKQNLSYDCDGGEKCPHCGEYLQKPYYWLDHESTLIHAIVDFLGLNIYEKITECVKDTSITGDRKEDSETIAESILNDLIR